MRRITNFIGNGPATKRTTPQIGNRKWCPWSRPWKQHVLLICDGVILTDTTGTDSIVYQGFCKHLDKPNHPPPTCIQTDNVVQIEKLWNLVFLVQGVPWPHREGDIISVLCFDCMQSHEVCGSQAITKKAGTAFVSWGYTNWKKVIEKFKAHESSHAHAAAVSQHLQSKSPVIVQMSTCRDGYGHAL